MHGHVLVLAGEGHTGYAYALAQGLHGKVFLSFLVPEGDATKDSKGIEKCRKESG